MLLFLRIGALPIMWPALPGFDLERSFSRFNSVKDQFSKKIMRHLIQEYTTPHIGYKAGQQQAESAFVILLWERLRRWMDCDSISQIVSHSLQNSFYLHYSDPIVSRLRRQPVPLAALALMALFRYRPAWRAGSETEGLLLSYWEVHKEN
jgi:hypothetical protein